MMGQIEAKTKITSLLFIIITPSIPFFLMNNIYYLVWLCQLLNLFARFRKPDAQKATSSLLPG